MLAKSGQGRISHILSSDVLPNGYPHYSATENQPRPCGIMTCSQPIYCGTLHSPWCTTSDPSRVTGFDLLISAQQPHHKQTN